jgi:heme/copper-type cytochrome/quinol oxidase subunit 3
MPDWWDTMADLPEAERRKRQRLAGLYLVALVLGSAFLLMKG